MKPTDNQIRDLGFMFKKMWNAKEPGIALNGFTMVLDALGIPWSLVPDKDDFSAVVIAGTTFKLK